MSTELVNAPGVPVDSQREGGAKNESGTQPLAPKHRRVRRQRVALGASLFLAFVLAVLAFMGQLSGNVRAVIAGQVYRSGQLTGSGFGPLTARLAGNDLQSVLRRDHIATVVNLRGGSEKDGWYRDERAVCDLNNAAHIDVGMSAIRLPAPEKLMALLNAFDHARYPLLFHCQGGSDRSGLAGTIYLNVYQHVPLDQAEAQQLTWRFGHLSFTRTRAMDQFFTMYRQTGNGLGLRDWIVTRYPAEFARAPEDLKPKPDKPTL